MDKKEKGLYGEELAARYLSNCGYRILEKNYLCKIGEIDIVAIENNELVFIEVRTKRKTEYGRAVETVNHTKQRKLRRVAEYYLMERKKENEFCRFDVLGIEGDLQNKPAYELIKAAF